MTTKEAVKAVFESEHFSPSPSALALLAAHAREDKRLWAVTIAKPFASGDALAQLEGSRSEWYGSVASLGPLGKPPEALPPAFTWSWAAEGLSREAGEWLDAVRTKAQKAQGAAKKTVNDFETQKERLRDIASSLRAHAQDLENIAASKGKVESTQPPVSPKDLEQVAKDTSTLVKNLKGVLNIDPTQYQSLQNAASFFESAIGTAVRSPGCITLPHSWRSLAFSHCWVGRPRRPGPPN